MTARQVLLLVLATLSALVAAPASDAVAQAPACSASYDPSIRPGGLPRTLSVSCSQADSIELAAQPAHGTVTDLSNEVPAPGWLTARMRLRADADARGELVVPLVGIGPGGTTPFEERVRVRPPSENRPPTCGGDRRIEGRTDGLAPATFRYWVVCEDPDGDHLTMQRTGPGEHRAEGPGPADAPVGNFTYRSATAHGVERPSIIATDELGARTEHVLEVVVGPEIDRAPMCSPGSAAPLYGPVEHVVAARPGATRRVVISCADQDHDPVELRVAEPPSHGTVSIAERPTTRLIAWGTERTMDVVFTPGTPDAGRSAFTVVGSGSGGETHPIRVVVDARPPGPAEWEPSCTPGAQRADADRRTILVPLDCWDDEADRLRVGVVVPPAHGTATVAMADHDGTSARQEATLRYAPAPGYIGPDSVRVQVTDGMRARDVDVPVLVTTAVPPLPRPEPGVPPVRLLPTLRDGASLPDEQRLTLGTAPEFVGRALRLTVITGNRGGALTLAGHAAPWTGKGRWPVAGAARANGSLTKIDVPLAGPARDALTREGRLRLVLHLHVVGGRGAALARRITTVAVAPRSAAPRGGARTLRGGFGVQRLRGGGLGDRLLGMSGNDVLLGLGGDDDLFGGTGNDVLEAGAGDDALDGFDGDDDLRGGAGRDDLVESRFGDDRLDGGPGDDVVRGGRGEDRLRGGEGDDVVGGGSGPDVTDCGPGEDVGFVNFFAERSRLTGCEHVLEEPGVVHLPCLVGGTDAPQTVLGTERDDTCEGRGGDDDLEGRGGDDVLDGGAGRDRMFGRFGADRLLGGEGDDEGEGGRGRDVLDGGAGDDRLNGGYDVDLVRGGAGDDRIVARGGGADRIDCGPGARDVAIVDSGDDVRGCERVSRSGGRR